MRPDDAPALLLQHDLLAPPGILEDWLRESGMTAMIHHVTEDGELPAPDGFAFVASLGSRRSPGQTEDPCVARELKLLRTCVEREVPVLGLCFGGQALAVVLGGTVEVMGEPELGWCRVETAAPHLIAEGPWLQWHYESFTTPHGAEELASSAMGPQAFRLGPHLGVQFHSESTATSVARWALHDRDRLPGPLEDYLERLKVGERRHGRKAADAARRLFDGFWPGRAQEVA